MIRVAALVLLMPALAGAQTAIIYSRSDAQQAHRAYALAAVYSPAQMDRSMLPGVAWRPAIGAMICGASVVLVVWSGRAAASPEVRRELDTAMLCRVPVVPVLLDSTPLPGLLAEVNAVDWRE